MDAAVKAYRQTSQRMDRDQLITDHLRDVHQILGRLIVTLPDSVDRENLQAAGVLGLVEAAHHFDPSRNVDFGAFARFRIRGAILDELRRNSPMPQHMMERWGVIRRTIADVDGAPSVETIARLCGLTEEEVDECLDSVRLARPEEYHDDQNIPRGAELTESERSEVTSRLAAAIEQLDERLRAIVVMYYRDQLRLKEIGEVLNLSESRISRLLRRAHEQLRKSFGTSPSEQSGLPCQNHV